LAGRLKDEFLAMLAHELRNPLAPVMTSIDILRLQSEPNSQMEKTLDIAERQIDHMSHLLDDLLDVFTLRMPIGAATPASPATLLTELDHEVRVVNDGPAALQVAAVFSAASGRAGHRMPEMDGYEVARTAAARARRRQNAADRSDRVRPGRRPAALAGGEVRPASGQADERRCFATGTGDCLDRRLRTGRTSMAASYSLCFPRGGRGESRSPSG
jgi:CheY-like chemotaxis protein